MDEIRRRQEGLTGGGDPDPRAPGDDSDDDDPSRRERPDDDDRASAEADDESGAADDTEAAEDDEVAEDDDDRHAEPEGGGPRRPRPVVVGGPNDGAPGRRGRLRGPLIVLAIGAIFLILTLAGALLDLVTDAMWFKSVGYDAVFFTRLGTQAVLFIVIFVAVSLFLGGNIWLAGRLAPPPDPERTGSVGAFATRLGEAFGIDTRDGSPMSGPRGRSGPGGRRPIGRPGFEGVGFGGPGGVGTINFGAEDLPDLVPVFRWVLIGLAVVIALGAAGSAAGQWETVQLWRNQVPYSLPGVAPVVDPIFGRDISYYLFELPFLRVVQSAINALLIAALVLSFGRYLLAGVRGGLAFTTSMRVHLAVLGGLYLLSVAWGYQLDKLELVYSVNLIGTQGGNFVGVGYTDQNARFLAFDVLTAVSAFAGGVPRHRGVHPRDVAARGGRRHLVQRLGRSRDRLPRPRPAPECRARSAEQGDAVHRQQHQHDPGGVRHHRLGTAGLRWRSAAHPGGGHVRGVDLPERPALGLPPAQGLAGAAPDGPPVLRLPGRRHRPLPDRRHEAPGDAVGPRAGPRAQPAGRDVGQPADHLHPRDRHGDGSGQRGDRGRPAAPDHPGPAIHVARWRAAGDPTPDLLRGATERLDHHRRPPGRVRLSGRDHGHRRSAGTGPDHPLERNERGEAGHDPLASPVRPPLPRPQPAHQRPGDRRQPAPVPPLDRRSAAPHRAVPPVRQGPLPGRDRGRSVRLHPGRLHHQRPLPERPVARSGRAAGREQPGPGALQLPAQQREDRHGRLHRRDDLLRGRPERPDHPDLRADLPDPVQAALGADRT